MLFMLFACKVRKLGLSQSLEIAFFQNEFCIFFGKITGNYEKKGMHGSHHMASKVRNSSLLYILINSVKKVTHPTNQPDFMSQSLSCGEE